MVHIEFFAFTKAELHTSLALQWVSLCAFHFPFQNSGQELSPILVLGYLISTSCTSRIVLARPEIQSNSKLPQMLFSFRIASFLSLIRVGVLTFLGSSLTFARASYAPEILMFAKEISARKVSRLLKDSHNSWYLRWLFQCSCFR